MAFLSVFALDGCALVVDECWKATSYRGDPGVDPSRCINELADFIATRPGKQAIDQYCQEFRFGSVKAA